ncbi:SGNH hydrolase domain-containing protein [Rathayibacter festucae]|uniref:Acyltransferase n=1 Tax=Rathayibacter festucae DSM 15932 TaxID=1328866 RepID=A0A3T0SXP1_9MICO|nr:SGNH hydrolase domain-containing protein [Rathayibacter festucae]AZZ51151.1 acyltransferase [Rathayibacter festucae DSM 15932]
MTIRREVTPKLSLAKMTATGSFRHDIQGLRAVAVALVIADHVDLPPFHGGYIGVDVFFVISGFLITSHLMSRLRSTGRIGFADFYARRMRRILPAALLVAGVSLVAALLFMPPLTAGGLTRMAIATALYVPNLELALSGTNYLAERAPSPFQHYWSLGVEEQFYIVWPLVLLALFVVLRRSPRAIAAGLAVLVLASFVLCVLLTERSQPWAFFSSATRAWELGTGGLVACLVSSGWLKQVRDRVPALLPALGWVGLSGTVLAAVMYSDSTLFPSSSAALPVMSTALVILGGSSLTGAGPVRLLRWAPFQAGGRISYSLYLWHWPLLVIPQAAVGLSTPLPLWLKGALMLLAIGLAELTYRFVEAPSRNAPMLVQGGPRRSLWVGGAASVALVLLAMAAVPLSAARPLSSTRINATEAPSDPPRFSPVVPANLSPGLSYADESTSEVHRNGCHIPDSATTTVNDCVLGDASGTVELALFGDSHAAHWFGGLSAWAEGESISLRSYTKVGCPSVPVLVLDASTPYTACTQWRDAVIQRLVADPPDVILLSNTDRLPFAAGEPRSDVWTRAIGDLALRLPASARVLMIADTPKFPEEAPRCLSAHLEDAADCGIPRSEALDQAWIDSERGAAHSAGMRYADLNDFFCTATRCEEIVGNTLLYRDTSHLTETWSVAMRNELAAAITPSLAG